MAQYGENIYKRKDGRWEARVIKGYNDNGKAVYAYFYGRTYKEVKGKIYICPPCVKPDSIPIPKDDREPLLFGSILDIWLEYSKIRLKESSYVKYFNFISNHIKPALGELPLQEINNMVLNAFIADKIKNGKLSAEGGLSEKTVKDIMTLIKSVLRFAEKESLFSGIGFDFILPRERKNDIRALSKNEQTAFEKYLCADIDESKLGILLCMYTGLRIGEICALKWGDISLNEKTLTVSRTMQRIQVFESKCSPKTKITVTAPKSDSSRRVIPLPDCLIDKLKAFYPNCADAFVLTGERGQFIEPRTYHNRFKSYMADCNIKSVNFHVTRHTFATRCVEVGFDVKSLSEILGHANVNITLNRYVHPSFDLKRNNMNKLTALH